MDHETYVELRAQILKWFGDDAAAFRRFMRDLPMGDGYGAQLPVGTPRMVDLVSSGLDLLEEDGVWERLGPAVFDALLKAVPGSWPTILQWQRYVLGVRDAALDRGDYGVVLVHHGDAAPAALAQELAAILAIDPETASARVARPPVGVIGGLSDGAALRVGRRLERIGAVVSYASPPATRQLPSMRRSASGHVLAWVPGSDAGAAAPPISGYWLMRAPVTQSQFMAVMKRDPSRSNDRPAAPVDNVSRDEAWEFCARLSALEGLTQAPYRLPTEAEWEWAAMANEATRFPGGDRWWDVACAGGTETQPVCGRAPNAWGLYDMAGNVWEWVADSDKNGAAPNGLLKGGSFASQPADLVSSARRVFPPGDRHPGHGLRAARSSASGADDHEGRGSHDRR